MSIQLLAETPRAGRLNHRFIVAQGSSIGDALAQTILTQARDQAEGKDYLAVSRSAQQTGGREGEEILVLHGVNVQALSQRQREEIRAKLKRYLDALETLVTKDIDWEHEGVNPVLQRAELKQWEQAFKELTKVSLLKQRWVMMAGAAVVLLVSTWFFAWFDDLGNSGTPEPSVSVEERFTQQLTQLGWSSEKSLNQANFSEQQWQEIENDLDKPSDEQLTAFDVALLFASETDKQQVAKFFTDEEKLKYPPLQAKWQKVHKLLTALNDLKSIELYQSCSQLEMNSQEHPYLDLVCLSLKNAEKLKLSHIDDSSPFLKSENIKALNVLNMSEKITELKQEMGDKNLDENQLFSYICHYEHLVTKSVTEANKSSELRSRFLCEIGNFEEALRKLKENFSDVFQCKQTRH